MSLPYAVALLPVTWCRPSSNAFWLLHRETESLHFPSIHLSKAQSSHAHSLLCEYTLLKGKAWAGTQCPKSWLPPTSWPSPTAASYSPWQSRGRSFLTLYCISLSSHIWVSPVQILLFVDYLKLPFSSQSSPDFFKSTSMLFLPWILLGFHLSVKAFISF